MADIASESRCMVILVSQYAAKKVYQVLNPDEDTFILNNPTTKEKIWCFICSEEGYDDKLVYCMTSVQNAKLFAFLKRVNFMI